MLTSEQHGDMAGICGVLLYYDRLKVLGLAIRVEWNATLGLAATNPTIQNLQVVSSHFKRPSAVLSSITSAVFILFSSNIFISC